jgi:hypothetical protein
MRPSVVETAHDELDHPDSRRHDLENTKHGKEVEDNADEVRGIGITVEEETNREK